MEKQQALKDKRIILSEYKIWRDMHEISCHAREYGMYNSAVLESKLAPVIFNKSLEQKLIYSTVIADGNDKSVVS